MNTAYRAFRESIGRDGPDYTVLENVPPPQYESLVQALLDNLDFHNALALGRIKALSASTRLKECLSDIDPFTRLGAARALWDIEQSEDALHEIAMAIEDVVHTDQFTRVEAIGLLTDVLHPFAFATLEGALFDPEYLVRYNAAAILSHNSRNKTSTATIERNLVSFDRERIERFAQRMRGKQ